MRIALMAGLVLVAVGCTTAGTRFHETTYARPDGSILTITDYRANSTAAPLGELDTTSHNWAYRWGDGNEIETGQDAAGLDNTGQAVLVDLVQVLLGDLRAMVDIKAQAKADVYRQAIETGERVLTQEGSP